MFLGITDEDVNSMQIWMRLMESTPTVDHDDAEVAEIKHVDVGVNSIKVDALDTIQVLMEALRATQPLVDRVIIDSEEKYVSEHEPVLIKINSILQSSGDKSSEDIDKKLKICIYLLACLNARFVNLDEVVRRIDFLREEFSKLEKSELDKWFALIVKKYHATNFQPTDHDLYLEMAKALLEAYPDLLEGKTQSLNKKSELFEYKTIDKKLKICIYLLAWLNARSVNLDEAVHFLRKEFSKLEKSELDKLFAFIVKKYDATNFQPTDHDLYLEMAKALLEAHPDLLEGKTQSLNNKPGVFEYKTSVLLEAWGMMQSRVNNDLIINLDEFAFKNNVLSSPMLKKQ